MDNPNNRKQNLWDYDPTSVPMAQPMVLLPAEVLENICSTINELGGKIDSLADRIEGDVIGDDWLNTEEAAKFLGISVVTLAHWREKKYIPYSQFSRVIRYSKKDLEEFLRNRHIKTRA